MMEVLLDNYMGLLFYCIEKKIKSNYKNVIKHISIKLNIMLCKLQTVVQKDYRIMID